MKLVKMKFDERDVRYEEFSGSGPGGQHRNRHANCIRAIHVPTGVVAAATSERSMTANMRTALANLKAKLAAMTAANLAEQRKMERDDKPLNGFGGGAIRTYRLCGKDVGVTDHRDGVKRGINVLLKGELDEILADSRRTRP